MRKIAIAVHGGAGDFSLYLRKKQKESDEGIKEALYAGYQLLRRGKSSLDAVEAAVMKLEDNPLFNAGRGSVLNGDGKVEMDAAIMDGKKLKAGAVSMVQRVKNPIYLARLVMKKTRHVMLSGYGALDFAKDLAIPLEPESYFITDYQHEAFKKTRSHESNQKIKQENIHGTVGAVALDQNGNLAAATSTGGIINCLPGRVGDSCIIGAGCYANNKTCAISGTGVGEYLMTRVVAHSIAMLIALKKMSLQKACQQVIFHQKIKPFGDVGVIALNQKGDISMVFNTTTMRRGFIDVNGDVKIMTRKPTAN